MNPDPVLGQLASVLVVDDSTVQRAHAVALCRRLGVQTVYEAASGEDALDLLTFLEPRPQLVIVDLEMPNMDGVELIQQLHQRALIVPLIVASGRESSLIHSVEILASNLGFPVLAALKKPIRSGMLELAFGQFGLAPGVATEPARLDPSPLCPRALAQAITAGEITVQYQPKVDLATGAVRGMEALARWHRPTHGFTRPDHFIALAEKEGLIHALTLSVLDQALAQAARWNATGMKVSMAINLSPRLLDRPSLVQEVSDLVAAHGLEAAQVVLEITESSLVDFMGAALGVLTRLRLKGFGLSIDDYGTGFSSMQQLSRIPFTELKVDRSFVHGAHQRSNLRVILQSALDMARQLDLVSVAEGIETTEDWRLLQECGCDVGQGYLISRPLPAADMPLWLRRHETRLPTLRAARAPSQSLQT